MATIGVSKPKFAIYNFDPETKTVSYSGGGVLGKMTQIDVTINTSENNNLYADNGIAETDRQFTDGTITEGTDDLSQEVSKVILGAREVELEEIPGITDTGVKELIFDDGLETPYLGRGFIIKKQRQNKVSWRAVVFTKTMTNVPDESATTQGEQIEWQTPTLVSTILRDDTPNHMWKREATFTTEEQAEIYLNYRLNISTENSVPGDGGIEATRAASSVATYAANKNSEKV